MDKPSSNVSEITSKLSKLERLKRLRDVVPKWIGHPVVAVSTAYDRATGVEANTPHPDIVNRSDQGEVLPEDTFEFDTLNPERQWNVRIIPSEKEHSRE